MNLELFHFLLAVVASAALVVLLIRPHFILLFLISLVIFFPLPSWGIAHGAGIFNLYSKGTGVLPVSLFTLALWSLFVVSLLLIRSKEQDFECRIRIYLWGFIFLFIGFVFTGILTGVPIRKAMSSMGAVNIFNMSLMTLILIRSFQDPKLIHQFTRVFLLCTLARGVWLVIRYVFFGGDPANAYANLQGIQVKLTSYDIADSMIACIAAVYASWQLTWGWKEQSAFSKLFYLSIISIELFVILFSFRRAAWIGFVLAALIFTIRQPWRRRIQVFTISGFFGLFAFSTAAYWRLSKVSRGGYTGTLFYDLTTKGKLSLTEGRFSELAIAFETIKENLFFGVGTWGGYGQGGSMEFMHSGPFHIWLKMGLVGLVSFFSILLSYSIYYFSRRKYINPKRLGMFEAGFAGFIFLVPHMLVGSLIIEIRTLIILGIALALPYIVYGAYISTAQIQHVNEKKAVNLELTLTKKKSN